MSEGRCMMAEGGKVQDSWLRVKSIEFKRSSINTEGNSFDIVLEIRVRRQQLE
jgi:hypothetical protein